MTKTEEMMPVVPKQKGKAKAAVAPDSDEEMGKALFDMDVDEPISRPRSAASDAAVVDGGDGPQTSEPEDGDIEMEDDSDPAPVKKARKPKKVVPVGRNGLKKRRVIKKRKTVNEKGYTQTEDYSEYESVDEEETQEVTAPKKSKSTPAAGPSTSPSKSEESKKSKQETKKAEPKKTSKAPAKKPIGKQKDLSSFFGKK
ncbi:hypothetical protein DL96DRAFT_1704781 [Flagelloscypha sp. PMI_526]|nr:hypothetical protein DL96DRAFT_1704781 [Flagelloscypha sp. PMI_526]